MNPKKKQGPRILAERKGPLFISEKNLDPETGNHVWTASAIEDRDPAQSIKIHLPNDSRDREKILRSLENNWDIADVHLVQRSNGNFEIIDAKPALPDAKRTVYDEKGEAYSWTHELDAKVDSHFQHTLQLEALTGLIATKHEFTHDITPSAVAKGHELAKQYGLTDNDAKWEEPNWNGGLGEAMLCRQINTNGEIEQKFYNPLVPLDEQVKIPTDPIQLQSVCANYALQQAVYQKIVERLDEPTNGMSRLECKEKELVERKTLFGGHPNRTTGDYYKLNHEYAQQIALMTVQGAACNLGAQCANPDEDYVTPTNESSRDSNGDPYTIQSSLAMRAKTELNLSDFDPEKHDALGYLSTLATGMEKEEVSNVNKTELAIAHEMDKAMAKGRERIPDKLAKARELTDTAFGHAGKGMNDLTQNIGAEIF